MTKILALDSSTDACSVALLSDGKVSSRFEIATKSHTQRLLPMVDELLKEQHCALVSLDAIAFTRGPGSFTGLRICMGIVQGLAFGANLPVIPISTLQVMAQHYQQQNPQNTYPIMACLDARMNEVYAGLFSAEIQPSSLMEEAVFSPAHLWESFSQLNLPHKIIGIGSGWNYTEMTAFNCVEQQIDFYPQATAILTLAEKAWIRKESLSILDAELVYLRDSVSWQKRQRIRTQS